jgi:tripartite ATP-independent transporter DctP family solute receptor
MKLFTQSLLSCCLATTLACGTLFSANTSAQTTLRLAYASNSQPVKDALALFGKLVEEKTDGEVKVMYFPDSQLGGERELVELTQTGAVDITKVSGGLMESFSPVYGVFSMPYLFDNEQHFYQVMDNPEIMDGVYQSTKNLGFVGLTWYDSGQRSFYTKSKPIKTLDDLKGMKIRVMQSQTAIRMMELLGAAPVAMGQAEVYTSIQQGILDGAENNEFALTVARHAEVAKHYSMDTHTRIPDIVLISSMALAQLSDSERQAVFEAARESTEFEKQAWKTAIDQAQQESRDKFGVAFYDVDIAPFQQAVQPMYDELKSDPQLYGLYQQIRSVAKN